MIGLARPTLGLMGRIFAILLLAVMIEVGASYFYQQRSDSLSVRDDEARRLAEHLVISRKLLAASAIAERSTLASDLTTLRYGISWSATKPASLQVRPTLDRIYQQVVAWEPSLAGTALRLRLVGSARNAVIVGSLALPDGSWMQFATREPIRDLTFSWERILPALAPAFAIILIGGMLVRRTLLPIRRLASAVDRVGDGETAIEPLPESGPAEARRLIAAFNRMQARIQRLINNRTQTLAAVGHDLRTPLSRLLLRAEAIREDEIREPIQTDIAEMLAMIESLLTYLSGDSDPERPVAIDLAVLCQTIADDASDHGHAVAYAGPDHLEIRVRPIGIKRAIVNLVENGTHYGDRVWVRLSVVDGGAVIAIEDDGPGIEAAELAKALQPFVRLDLARRRDTQGLGLGLSIVVRAVEQEGGTFTLSNRPTGGLRAEIRLCPTERQIAGNTL